MELLRIVVIVQCLLCFGEFVTPQIPPYDTRKIEQFVDHFNYQTKATFLEKYLITYEFWKGKGPMLFYTGNEGDIESFYENSGFVFELAKDFDALVVFAEHRYYGESLPFGRDFSPANMGYLTVEQALADYAVLVQLLKETYQITNVVALGGSYGGMLAAWFRFKYPNMVVGALAASAPLKIPANLTDPYAFFGHVTEDFASVDARCPQYVREAFVMIDQLAAQGESGLKKLEEEFLLCDQLHLDKVEHLKGWVRNSFTSLAMTDYPYPASFLAPLPAFPVNASCELLLKEKSRLRGLALAAGLFYNGTTGSLKCFNITEEYVECADPTGCGLDLDSQSWDYQACTELPMICATNNMTDMFPPVSYDPTEYCQQKWGVSMRRGWTSTQFWGVDILSSSNIIFSNGNLDPWAVGGFLHDLSDSLVAILIEGGAHHLDLRSSNPQDPPAVIAAREEERKIISKWIAA